MESKIRSKKIEFWVSKTQEEKILENMKRNGMSNLSEFLRILACSEAEIHFSVRVPDVMRVSEAHLHSGLEEGGTMKRATG
jgi:hypothetical protein